MYSSFDASRHRPVRRVLAAALLCATTLVAPAHAQEEGSPAGPVEDGTSLDAHLAGLREAVCASDQQLCRHLKAFANAIPPCFPQGQGLTVGHAQVIADDGAVTPSRRWPSPTRQDGFPVESDSIWSIDAVQP